MTHPQRKSPRLQGYDASRVVAYFITVCTHNRQHLFSQIRSGVNHLSPLSVIASEELVKTPRYWKGVDIDLFVVMPNHVHAIIVLPRMPYMVLTKDTLDVRRHVPTLSLVIGNYRGRVAKLAHKRGLISDDILLWQGRYHQHLIHDERELNKFRQHIIDNPTHWDEDTFFRE